jgi:hypothetical protein
MNRISFADFDAWTTRQERLIRDNAFFDAAHAFEDEGVMFHHGDLVVDELMVAPVTVIDGNVSARKIGYPFDVGLLVVTGNLTCEHIGRMGFDVIVGGHLQAQSVCVNTSNDYLLRVGGDITCDFFSEYGCAVEVQGRIICPRVLSLMNEVVAHGGIEGELIDNFRGKDVAQVLVSEVLTDDGYFDEEKFEAHVRSGKSPYKV